MQATITTIIIFLLVGIGHAPAQSYSDQYSQKRTLFQVYAGGGISTFAIGEAELIYDDFVDFAQSNGVPLETQRKYPANLNLNAGVLIHLIPQVLFGVEYSWMKTRALSLYEDQFGTLDVTSRFSLHTMQITMRWEKDSPNPIKPTFGFDTGMAMARANFVQDIQFDQTIGVPNNNLIIDVSNLWLTFAPFGGIKRYFSRYFLELRAGYRFAKVPSMEGSVTENDALIGRGVLRNEDREDISFDYSGIFTNVNIGIRLGSH